MPPLNQAESKTYLPHPTKEIFCHRRPIKDIPQNLVVPPSILYKYSLVELTQLDGLRIEPMSPRIATTQTTERKKLVLQRNIVSGFMYDTVLGPFTILFQNF